MFCLLVLALKKENIQAAGGFVHHHGDGCYAQVQQSCTDRKITRSETASHHCSTCQVMRSCTRYVDWYSCPSGGGERQIGGRDFCNTCGNLANSWAGYVPETHTVTKQSCTCPLTEGQQVAQITISQSSTDWTSGSVTLTAGVTELVAGSAPGGYQYSFGGTGGNTITAEANGTYQVTVTAANGQTDTAAITVSNIDKTAPTVSNACILESAPTGGFVTLSVSAADGESGLHAEPYSFDGGSSWQGGHTYSVQKNGNYTVLIRDKAGNKSSVNIGVSLFAAKPVTPTPAPTPAPSPSASQPSTGASSGNGSSANKPGTNTPATNSSASGKPSAISSTKVPSKSNNQKETATLDDVVKKTTVVVPGIYSSVSASKKEASRTAKTLGKRVDTATEGISESTENQQNAEQNQNNMENANQIAETTQMAVSAGGILGGLFTKEKIPETIAIISVLLCVSVLFIVLLALHKSNLAKR